MGFKKEIYKWLQIDKSIEFNFNLMYCSSSARLEGLYHIKKGYVNNSNKSPIIFKIKRGESSVIYAIAHQDNNEIKYICNSPSFISMDGEFRRRVVRYDNYKKLFDKNYEIVDKVEKYLLDSIENGEIELETLTTDENINNTRLDILLLCYAWISCINIKIHNLFENHINPEYVNTMFVNKDYEFMQSLMNEKIDKEIRNITVAITMSEIDDTEAVTSYSSEFGQKLIPLYIEDLRKTFSPKYNVWREALIYINAGKLPANNVCIGIPWFATWYALDNAENLFDNPSMKDKIKSSKEVEEILTEMEKINDKVGEKPIHMELAEKMQVPIKFIEKRMVLSGYAACFIIEYTGRTLYDVPQMYRFTKTPYGDILKDISFIKKYMFETIYTLYCLNTKIGVIQGDLHLNNICIKNTLNYYQLLYESEDQQNHFCTVYKINSKFYRFYTKSAYPYIIDFSRGIISSKLSSEFSEDDVEDLLIKQRKEIVAAYKNNFPQWLETNKKALKLTLLDNFDLCFKVFTAYDLYSLTKRMTDWLPSLDTNKTIINYIDELRRMCEYYLITIMYKVINGKLNDIDWPMGDMLETFREFTFDKLEKEDIVVDYFDYNRELVYDIRYCKNLPPLVSGNSFLGKYSCKYNQPDEEKYIDRLKKNV